MRPFTYPLRLRLLAMADEEDRRRNLRRRGQIRAILRRNIYPFEIPEAEFIKTFRFGKATVKQLISKILPFMPRAQRSGGITVTLKILIALAFYATGSYQLIVGQSLLHNVSQTTVSRAVRHVTAALNNPLIFKNIVKWPLQRTERNIIKSRFYRFGIPGVLGCIDGTHVAILRPTIHEERYYNRKGYHSLNVMIICDSDLNILCVDPSSPGSSHDSIVWQSHPLSQHLLDINRNGEQAFLLGDSGYPLRQTMMTPILNTVEGTPQHHFYKLHVTARNTVERCIGVLKARFRCLLAARALHYDPITAGKIVNACCVLHNIANRSNMPVELLTPEELDAESRRQCQNEEHLRGAASLLAAHDPVNRRVNPDLLAGRALQQALVVKLWTERMA